MKTVGEQTKEFRLSKGWNTTRMGKEVGTSRQSIENLEAVGNRKPQYIVELARVMGTTVDDLLNGRFSVPLDSPSNQALPLVERVQSATELVAIDDKEMIRRLAAKLGRASEGMQKAILALLGEYAKNPNDDRLNRQIADLLSQDDNDPST